MALLEIVTVPDPILRRKAHKVIDFDNEFHKLVSDMVETMREAPGVGLAAPQVGVSLRLVVVEYRDDEEEKLPKKLYVLANPEVTEKSEEKVLGIEGCLSVPDLLGEVERYEKVVIKALNRQGKPVKVKAEGWLARVFQHEIDHLEGIVYTDLTEKIWKPAEDDETPLD
ncbi:MAG: peptide deformylase [Chloroflexi bacterium]|nr:peptide deformylase [Chloroflexota bacterium]